VADVTTGIKLEASGGETYAKDVEKAVTDTEKLETALEDVEKAADKADEAVNGKDGKGGVAAGMDDLKTSATEAATDVMNLTAAVLDLGSAIIEGTTGFAERGKALADNAAALGLSATAYQEWSFALDGTRDSLIGLQGGFERLNKIKLGSVKDADQILASVGLSAETAASMDTEALFGAVIEGLRGIADEAEQANAAYALFGTAAGRKLLPMLRMSNEELDAQKQKLYDTHQYLTDTQLENASAYVDSMERVDNTTQGVQDHFFSAWVKGLTTIREGFMDFFDEEFDWDKFDSFVEAVSEKFLAFGEYVIANADGIANAIKVVGGAWLAWKGVTVVATIVKDLQTAWALLTAMEAKLGLGGGALLGGAVLGASVVASGKKTMDNLADEYAAMPEQMLAGYDGLIGKVKAVQEGYYYAAEQLLEVEPYEGYNQEILDEFEGTYDELMAYAEQVITNPALLEQLRTEMEGARETILGVTAGRAGLGQSAEDYKALGFELSTLFQRYLQLQQSAEEAGQAVTGAGTAVENGAVTGQEAVDSFYSMVDDLNSAESRELEAIGGSAGTISTEFAAGVDEMSQAAADSTKNTNDVLAANMGVLSGNMAVWGSDMMLSFANGMLSGYNSFLLPAIDQVTGEINARFGHSEPEKGPLSDDSTWMPDMMASFAQGIRDNRWMVLDEMGALARGMETSFDPTLGRPGGGSSVSYGGVTVIFQVQDGQDGRDLFEEFSAYLEGDIAREEAVFAT